MMKLTKAVMALALALFATGALAQSFSQDSDAALVARNCSAAGRR